MKKLLTCLILLLFQLSVAHAQDPAESAAVKQESQAPAAATEKPTSGATPRWHQG